MNPQCEGKLLQCTEEILSVGGIFLKCKEEILSVGEYCIELRRILGVGEYCIELRRDPQCGGNISKV